MSTGNGSERLPDADIEQTEAIKVNKPPTMSELLENIAQSEDMDACILMAGVFNVYIDSMRRLQNRIHLGPQDMQNCLRICRVILTPPAYDKQFAPRNRQ